MTSSINCSSAEFRRRYARNRALALEIKHKQEQARCQRPQRDLERLASISAPTEWEPLAVEATYDPPKARIHPDRSRGWIKRMVDTSTAHVEHAQWEIHTHGVMLIISSAVALTVAYAARLHPSRVAQHAGQLASITTV